MRATDPPKVERIPEANTEFMSAVLAGQNEKLRWHIGKRSKADQAILLLDEDFFVLCRGNELNWTVNIKIP